MKLIELKLTDFKRIRHLFTQTEHLNFTIDAVIAGNTPGRILHLKPMKTRLKKSPASCSILTRPSKLAIADSLALICVELRLFMPPLNL